MKHIALTALCLALAACGSKTATTDLPAAAATERDRFNGVWELASFHQNEPDGSQSQPYGDKPVGQIRFDEAGRVTVFVMKPGRESGVKTTGAIPTASIEDLRAIADGFMGYWGGFRVEESSKTLFVQVTGSTLPAWANTEQKRTYELDGDTLTLITPATKLVWKRVAN